MLMVFIKNGNALLPELEIYRKHFEQKGFCVKITGPSRDRRLEPAVEWHFMGSGGHRIYSRSVLVHEYASASVPPFRLIKDQLKTYFNATPGLRIFLNEYVKSRFPFRDKVPYCFRDMGIPGKLLNDTGNSQEKVFAFISVGSMEPISYFNKLLEIFTKGSMRAKTLLVLTSEHEHMAEKWKQYPNIIFKGPVPHDEVFNYLRQSRYAINSRPPIEPFSRQTSTRTLEYMACRIPVISTESEWLKAFNIKYGGNYLILEPGLSNLEMKTVEDFEFSFPSMEPLTWDNIIESSGIDLMLEKLLREKGYQI